MNFKVIKFSEQLKAHQSYWRQFKTQSVFQTFDWVYASARQLEEQCELCVLFAFQQPTDSVEHCVGVIPLYVEDGLRRNLRPFEFNNGLDSAPPWIVDDSLEVEFLDSLHRLITDPNQHLPLIGRFDAFIFDVFQEKAIQKNWAADLTKAGFKAHYRSNKNRWSYHLPASYADFCSSMSEELASEAECLMEFVDSTIETQSSHEYDIKHLWKAFTDLKVSIEPDLNSMFADDEKVYWFGRAIEELAKQGLAEIRVHRLGPHVVSGAILLGSSQKQMIFDLAVSPFASLEAILEWTVLECFRNAIRRKTETLVVSDAAIQNANWKNANWGCSYAQCEPLCRAKFIPARLGAVIKDKIISSGQLILESVFSPN